MKKRSEELVELRPSIFLEEESSKPLEKFQNQVLRPILKYQQELWILEVKQNLFFIHIKSKRLKSFEYREAIKNVIAKTSDLKNRYIGIVIGLFTADEYAFYLENKTEINKRIVQMITERIVSIG
jgi:hypothetical protein